MITVTNSARDYLLSQLQKNNKESILLEVQGGGCAGFSYNYTFLDGVSSPIDIVVPLGQEKSLVIDGHSLMYVIGTELHYEEKLGGSQLVFNNPNEKSSCGCGKSFSV